MAGSAESPNDIIPNKKMSLLQPPKQKVSSLRKRFVQPPRSIIAKKRRGDKAFSYSKMKG